MGVWQSLLLTALAAALVYAAIDDWRRRTIPNWLNAAIALGAPLWWLALGLSPWPGMAIQLAIALGAFAVFAGFFFLGAMGGGDVKLIAALALWLPFGGFIGLLVAMSILGGALTLAMVIHHRVRRASGQPEIPYGIAIALAGLWSLYPTIS